VITGGSTHKLLLLLTWGFDGTFECGFSLPARAASCALSRGSRAPPVLAFGGGLCCVGPSQGLVWLKLHALVWCSNLRHFLPWFGRPE
jgi:hypothetical protein